MKLDFIELQDLKTSPINVRKNGDVKGDDLVPSIRSLGVLQPLLVRKNCEGYEIIAGQRRFDACLTLSQEQEIDPIPCVIMDDGDDARAIEASLAENIARLPMDKIDQYKAFSSLVKQGQDAEDIAAKFGVTKRLVDQRLAIANLYNPILNAYRREEVRAADVRCLTMATTKQQKAWWALLKEDNAPTGYALKHWLFDGNQVPVSNALFDLEEYEGAIISDLFGDERYFSDEAIFWEYQSKAITELIAEYRDDGWQDIEVLDVGVRFVSWEHVRTSKEDGGRIYIACASNGEVSIYDGYITQKEAKAKRRAEGQDNGAVNQKPETTKAMDNYLCLHKHAVVRAEILKNQQVALRLALAQMIEGSALLRVRPEPQKAMKAATAKSLAATTVQQGFEAERGIIFEMMDFDTESRESVISDGWPDMPSIFEKLVGMDDEAVLRIFTFVACEALPCDDQIIETLGQHFKIDMNDHWKADDAFFDLLKDKKVINAMVAEVAGDHVAEAHVTSTGKVQKGIIRQVLDGKRTAACENWQPRYMNIPTGSYLKDGQY